MPLRWPDCHNARDVGGLRLNNGRRINSRALIRSDNLDRLTPAGMAAVRAAGVSRIIDLRSAREVTQRPSPFAHDAVYVHRPYIDEQADLARDPVAESTQLATYCGGLGRNRRCIASVIAAIATAPRGAVVVHCASGKDRTGIVVALLLDHLGVVREQIAADYALTAERLHDRHQSELAAADPADRPALRELQRSRPETILGALSHLDSTYGSTAAYLRAIGVPPAHLTTIRSRLVN